MFQLAVVLQDPVLLVEDLLEARSVHRVALLAEQRGVVSSGRVCSLKVLGA